MTKLNTNSLIKCSKCELNFLSKEGLERHVLRIHKKKNQFKATKIKCEHCQEDFPSRSDFNTHKIKQRLLCKKCQENGEKIVSNNKCELIKHIHTVHRQELLRKKQETHSLECQRCHKTLKSVKQMKTHQESRSVLTCTKCNQKLSGFCNLELHLKNSCKKAKAGNAASCVTENKPVTGVNDKKDKHVLVPAKTAESIDEEDRRRGRRDLDDVDFFYPTFTAQQLIDCGVFTADSPSHFYLPDSNTSPLSTVTEETPSEYPPPQLMPVITNEVILGF